MKREKVSDVGFIHPKELPPDEKTVPISSRVRVSIQKRLMEIAKEYKLPAAHLIAHAVEKYVEFVEHGQKK